MKLGKTMTSGKERAAHLETVRNVCVYCGAAEGSDPRFQAAAAKLGKELATQGIGLVYGGGNNGLMGIVARSVLAHGGHVTGIIPDFLKKRELSLDEAQEVIVVPDMHTRKRMMFDRADAFVALPGGVGTLEELVEQLTWVQLGRHTKPVLIADIAGFWRPLLSLFAHMRSQGFIKPEFEVRYLVAEKVEDIVEMLRSAAMLAERLDAVEVNLDARL
jgi:uncharacterized protein (TIGR00730 family)